MPKRVQMTRQKPWRTEHPDAVIVDRRTRWGNPFRIHGTTVYGPPYGVVRATWGKPVRLDTWNLYVSCSGRATADGYVVDLFQGLLDVRARDEPDQLAEWLAPLQGRDLACWCGPADLCHADVLMQIANQESSNG